MARKTSKSDNLPTLSATAAAQLLSLSYASVVKLANQKKLPCVRDSTNRRLFKRSDLEALKLARAAK